ncbi:hypothetical protein J6590_038349 [Homalodisca vitripennis]|nr:hypothetical protein J6590_038349 [Homalodisca vitripennis]
MNKSLKLAIWNANGVATRRNELHLFAVDHDVDLILLTETHLQSATVFNVPGYQTYGTDGLITATEISGVAQSLATTVISGLYVGQYPITRAQWRDNYWRLL